MKGEPRLSFRKLRHLLKAKGIVGKHRVSLWEIALGLVLYQLGLSFRKTARVLGLLGSITVSYEDIRKFVEHALSPFHRHPLSQVMSEARGHKLR